MSKVLLRSLLDHQNFYNLETFKEKILNKEIFTADKKLCMKLLKSSEYKKMVKIIEGCMKKNGFKNIFEQLLAVFEVENLGRVFIMTEGIGWVPGSKKSIVIRGGREFDVQSFDIVNGEFIENRENVSVVCIGDSQVFEEIENGVEFLSKCGAAGYNINIILIDLERSSLNSQPIEVRPAQIKLNILNIYKTRTKKNTVSSLFNKKQDLCEAYKACILRNFQKVLKIKNP